ncbi:MAG: MFS transporter [Alphaproteobacteria bacterium]
MRQLHGLDQEPPGPGAYTGGLRRLGRGLLTPGLLSFAVLYGVETFSRSLLITVLPLQALRLLGDAQQVSVLFFVAALGGLTSALVVPLVSRHLRRGNMLIAAMAVLAAACALLATQTVIGTAAGIVLRMFSAAAVDVVLSLFVMSQFSRRDLSRFEPTRLFASAAGWTLGPWLGIVLASTVAVWVPFAATAGAGALVIVYARLLRLPDGPVRASRRPVNPLRYGRRFFVQPRLRLAWVLAAGRAGWWGMFFIYGPIFVVQNGMPESTGGLLASAGTAFLFIIPARGWVSRRYGLRWLMLGAYGATGILTPLAALATGWPSLVVVLLIMAAFAAIAIDAAGNVLFLRAVHPHERTEMAAVFGTYRDLSQLGPPGLFALVLRFLPLPAVFVIAGGWMVGLALLCRHIPRRM